MADKLSNNGYLEESIHMKACQGATATRRSRPHHRRDNREGLLVLLYISEDISYIVAQRMLFTDLFMPCAQSNTLER